jgi:hypothetical protein
LFQKLKFLNNFIIILQEFCMKQRLYVKTVLLFITWGLIFSACSLPIGDLLSGELSMKLNVAGDINFQNPNASKNTVGIINVYNIGPAIPKLYYSDNPDTGYREIPKSEVAAGTPGVPSQRNIEDVVEGDWYVAMDTAGLQAQLAIVKSGKDAIVTFGVDDKLQAKPGNGFLYIYNTTSETISQIRISPVQDDGTKAADFEIYQISIGKGKTWQKELQAGKYAAEAFWKDSFNGEPGFPGAKASVIFVIENGAITEAVFKSNPGYAADPGWDLDRKTSGNGTPGSPALIGPRSSGTDGSSPGSIPKGATGMGGNSWIWERPAGSGQWEYYDGDHNAHWYYNPATGKWYDVSALSDAENGGDTAKRYKPLVRWPPAVNNVPGTPGGPGFPEFSATGTGNNDPFPNIWPGNETWYRWADGSWLWERPKGSGHWEYYKADGEKHYYYNPVTWKWYDVTAISKTPPNKGVKFPLLTWLPSLTGNPPAVELPNGGGNPGLPPGTPSVGNGNPTVPPGGGNGNSNGNSTGGTGVDENGNPSTGDQTIVTDTNSNILVETNVVEGTNPYPSEDGYAGGKTNTGVLAIVNMYMNRRVSRIEIYNDKNMTNRVMKIQLYDKANPDARSSRLLDFKQQIKVVLNSGSGDAGRGYYVKVWFGTKDSSPDKYEYYQSANKNAAAYVFNGITTQLTFDGWSENDGLRVYNFSYFPSNTRYRQSGNVKLYNYITEGISGTTMGVPVTVVDLSNPSGRKDTLYREVSNNYGRAPAWNAASKGPDPIAVVPYMGAPIGFGQAYDSGPMSPGMYWVKVKKSSTTLEYGDDTGYYKRLIVPECITTNLTFNGTAVKSTQPAFEPD